MTVNPILTRNFNVLQDALTFAEEIGGRISPGAAGTWTVSYCVFKEDHHAD